MTAARARRTALRTAGRVAAGLAGVQVLLAGGGWLAARHLDEGDESTVGIRRFRAAGGVTLRPANPQLTRVRVGLLCAGGEVDLTGLAAVPGGVDVTARVLCGGLAVAVPPGWRVWWRGRGIGGVGGEDGVQRTDDERGADLRVHATVVFAGVGIEARPPSAAGGGPPGGQDPR